MTAAGSPDPQTLERLCRDACMAAEEAAAAILRIYAQPFEARIKADRSPVTDADEAAEAAILRRLRALLPSCPVISEEAVASGATPDMGDGVFWLVDPLDGTREFLARNGEFTVNIALVAEARPVLGVVLLPTTGECFFSYGAGCAFHRAAKGGSTRIAARRRPPGGGIAVASRSHGDAATERYLAMQTIDRILHIGSSLKFCRLAEGAADLYPRFTQTMEWDTAAGDAVLRAAGGSVCTLDGAPLAYGKPALRNPPFIARGRD